MKNNISKMISKRIKPPEKPVNGETHPCERLIMRHMKCCKHPLKMLKPQSPEITVHKNKRHIIPVNKTVEQGRKKKQHHNNENTERRKPLRTQKVIQIHKTIL